MACSTAGGPTIHRRSTDPSTYPQGCPQVWVEGFREMTEGDRHAWSPSASRLSSAGSLEWVRPLAAYAR
ncbi:MAG: hypothetical protein ACR2G2_12470 [Pseudonocardia sp.]